MNLIRRLRRCSGLTQARLAELGGTSQPTIAAYEAGRKSPTLRTLDRLTRAVGLTLAVDFVPPLTREDRRSLALHEAVATRLAEAPDTVRWRARRNLALLHDKHPHASRLWREWKVLLDLSTPDLIDVLRDARPHARELRHVSPFAGVLHAAERAEVYRRFREAEAQS